jgi:hypothetical protein
MSTEIVAPTRAPTVAPARKLNSFRIVFSLHALACLMIK